MNPNSASVVGGYAGPRRDVNTALSLSTELPSSAMEDFAGVDCTLSLATASTKKASAPQFYQHSIESYTPQKNDETCCSGMSEAGNLHMFFVQQQQGQKAASDARQTSYIDPRQNWQQQQPPQDFSHLYPFFAQGLAMADSRPDPRHFLGRICAHCGTTKTPLWRNGPLGPKSLCNACGIRFKKVGRRSEGPISPDLKNAQDCENPQQFFHDHPPIFKHTSETSMECSCASTPDVWGRSCRRSD